MDGNSYLRWKFPYYGHVNVTVEFIKPRRHTVYKYRVENDNELVEQVPHHNEVTQCITTILPSSRCNCSISGQSQWISNVTEGICHHNGAMQLFLYTIVVRKYKAFS